MCGRFDVDASNREIERLLALLPPGSPPVRTGEVFPSANVLTLTENTFFPQVMTWGFPKWDGKGRIINARAESVLTKPFFKKAFLTNPIAIPVTGFYEWQQRNHKKDKFFFSPPNAGVFYLAGFWKPFPDTPLERHFTILTTAANPSMRSYHHRMPVLLQQAQLPGWLTGAMREEILKEQPFPVTATLCVEKP